MEGGRGENDGNIYTSYPACYSSISDILVADGTVRCYYGARYSTATSAYSRQMMGSW